MKSLHANPGEGSLLESITDTVLAVDQEWVITYINPGGAAACEREPEELVGRSLWDLSRGCGAARSRCAPGR